MHKLIVAVTVAIIGLALVMIGCAQPAPPAPVKEVTVGNKGFTEQYIVGQLMKQVLEEHGFKVNLVSDLSSMALREGMEAGDIDICADYTGTAWIVYLGRQYKAGTINSRLYELVKQEERGNNFIWLDPMWNNNTYCLASWSEFVKTHDLRTLSDLAALYVEKEGKIETFVSPEFSTRPDGLPALEKHFNFKLDEATLKTGTPPASLLALEERRADVAMVFATDAFIAKHGWHVYLDNKAFFPPYDLTSYVRADILDKYPEITDILNELVATFPGGGAPATPEIVRECQKAWQKLNAKVEINKMEPDQVASEYLVEHGLIRK